MYRFDRSFDGRSTRAPRGTQELGQIQIYNVGLRAFTGVGAPPIPTVNLDHATSSASASVSADVDMDASVDQEQAAPPQIVIESSSVDEVDQPRRIRLESFRVNDKLYVRGANGMKLSLHSLLSGLSRAR